MRKFTSGYIITKIPSVSINYNWTMKDSVDGVLYDDIFKALTKVESVEGAGVQHVILESESN